MLGARNFSVMKWSKWSFRWSRQCVSPEPDDFFNRSKELQLLEDVTKGDTKITTITGPVNSGKSRLLTKLMEKLRKKHVLVLDINLHSISFNSVDSLSFTLQQKLNLWANDFEETSRKFQLDASVYDIRFGVAYEIQRKPIASMPPLAKLSGLLDYFSNIQLPPPPFWQKRQTPVFIIDEASELWSLKEDPNGESTLHSLFKWLVMNSKEKKEFQVLFCSSDSFFHLWVGNYVGTHRYQTCVIRDLPKDEAGVFWQLLHKNGNNITFEEAYKLCGGNMFHLRSLYELARQTCMDSPSLNKSRLSSSRQFFQHLRLII